MKKRIRDFEKRVLEDVFEDVCDPDDHHPDCPPTNARCPYR